MRTLTLLGLLILLASCASGGSGTDCAAWRPIYVSRADVLTTETARAILAHNETGRRIGCW